MPKLIVHCHIWYTSMWNELSSYLKNLKNIPHTLYITICEDNLSLKNQILSFNPQAKIEIVPNIGFDIGPFIQFLHNINLSDYDYILKIHTKNNKGINIQKVGHTYLTRNRWVKLMFNSLLGSEQIIKHNLDVLTKSSTIGMIGSDYIIADTFQSYKDIAELIDPHMQKMGFGDVEYTKKFVAGTMFLCKANLMQPILNANYQITDFDNSNKNIHGGTLAHAFERLFGYIVTAQGQNIVGFDKSIKNDFINFLYKLGRFIYQKKQTNKGKTVIKICKIPVYCH